MPKAGSLAGLFLELDKRGALTFLDHFDLSTLQLLKHPLGFAYAVLLREREYALRLHVWPESVRYEQHPFWPIHNHKFDLRSVVLAGSLTNFSYQTRGGDANPAFCLYRVTYDNDGSVMSATDEKIDVELTATEHVSTPDHYFVPAGVFHQTSVSPHIFTATLALTRDAILDLEIRTVGDVGGQQRYKYARSELLSTERHALLSTLESAL